MAVFDFFRFRLLTCMAPVHAPGPAGSPPAPALPARCRSPPLAPLQRPPSPTPALYASRNSMLYSSESSLCCSSVASSARHSETRLSTHASVSASSAAAFCRRSSAARPSSRSSACALASSPPDAKLRRVARCSRAARARSRVAASSSSHSVACSCSLHPEQLQATLLRHGQDRERMGEQLGKRTSLSAAASLVEASCALSSACLRFVCASFAASFRWA